MRMWMCDPKIMCRKHLLGEHVELHMFAGSIKKNISLHGYVKNNLLEYGSIIKRHKQLVSEMKRRGYNHNSELLIPKIKQDKEILNSKVNRESSIKDLLSRCNLCKVI